MLFQINLKTLSSKLKHPRYSQTKTVKMSYTKLTTVGHTKYFQIIPLIDP